MRLKKYLTEAVLTHGWPDTGGICGDDDAPTGNILLGRKYKKVTVNTPGGTYQMSVPEEEWTWDEFEHAKGMEVKDNYHETLDRLRDGYQKNVWRHTKKIGMAGDNPMGLDYEKLTAGTEESAPAYVLAVTTKGEPRELQKKNLPAVVFKIDYMLQQKTDTVDKGVEK